MELLREVNYMFNVITGSQLADCGASYAADNSINICICWLIILKYSEPISEQSHRAHSKLFWMMLIDISEGV